MSEGVRMGLIGCGRAAELLHLPAFAHVPEARLVAVSDPIDERRDLVASHSDACRAYPSPDNMLADANLDGVIVTTPPQTHAAMANMALQANLPVLVEKPLAASLAEAAQLPAEGKVMVAFNRRRWSPLRRLRGLLRQRHPNATITIKMTQISNASAWGAISGAADPLDDLGSHQLDLLRFLTGWDIRGIRASRTGPAAIEMKVVMADGSTATCLAAQSDASAESIRVEVPGRCYEARMGSRRLLPGPAPLRRALDLTDAVQRRLTGGRSAFTRSYELQLRHFVKVVRGEAAAEPDLADGLAVLRAVEAARRSADNEGDEVTLP